MRQGAIVSPELPVEVETVVYHLFFVLRLIPTVNAGGLVGSVVR
jgi:hypothetical protein